MLTAQLSRSTLPCMTLPPYTLRVSPRARRIILKVLPRQGLVVVLPKGCRKAEAERMVAGNLDWIADTSRRLRERGLLDAAPPCVPEALRLPAIAADYAVRLMPAPLARPKLDVSAGRILIRAEAGATEAALAALKGFVTRTARLHLPQRLRTLSRSLGLSFAEARIRTQRSRWGSCSADGNIQLNSKLLFLTPELVDHVLIHELCHIRHHDHGPGFHALLKKLSPRTPELAAQLKNAGAEVPAWMDGVS